MASNARNQNNPVGASNARHRKNPVGASSARDRNDTTLWEQATLATATIGLAAPPERRGRERCSLPQDALAERNGWGALLAPTGWVAPLVESMTLSDSGSRRQAHPRHRAAPHPQAERQDARPHLAPSTVVWEQATLATATTQHLWERAPLSPSAMSGEHCWLPQA